MSHQDKIQLQGVVVERLLQGKFKVKLEDGRIITAKCSGKIMMNYIRIIEGDEVTVEFSPYSPYDNGCIIHRQIKK